MQVLGPLGTFPVDPNSSLARLGADSYLVVPGPQFGRGKTYDAISQMVRPKPLLNNSVDMRGRFGKTAFFASASNLDQGGSIKYLDGFQRQSARMNLDQTIGTRWSAALTSYYAKTRQDGFYAEDGGNAFFRLTRSPPIANLNAVDSKGRLFIRTNLQSSGTQNNNPLYPLQNDHEYTKGTHYIGGGTLRYAATSWMDLEGNLSYDGSFTNLDNFDDKGYRQTNSSSDASFLRKESESITSYNSGINMNIRHDLLSDMHTRTSVRYGYGREDYDFRLAQVQGLAVIGVPALGNGFRTVNLYLGCTLDPQHRLHRRREHRFQGPLHPRRSRPSRCQLAVRSRQPLADVRPRIGGVARFAGAVLVHSRDRRVQASRVDRDRRRTSRILVAVPDLLGQQRYRLAGRSRKQPAQAGIDS